MEMTPEVTKVELNLGQLEKGGYPHFMLKEIFEQPDCIHDCMRGRVNVEVPVLCFLPLSTIRKGF